MSGMGVEPATETTARLSQWQRVAFIFTSPSKTFEDIKRGNRSWWLPLILFTVAAYLLFAVVSTKIGMQQAVDNQIRMNPKAQERLAQASPAARAMNEKIATYIAEFAFLANPVLVVAGIALLSLGLVGTINFVFGGRAKYGSVLAVWFYASLPSLVKPLLGIVAIYAGEAPESFNLKNFAPTNAAALFMDPQTTNKALYMLATSLDVTTVWTLVLLGMGTAMVAGVKRSSGYMAVFGWWAIFVLMVTAWAAAFG